MMLAKSISTLGNIFPWCNTRVRYDTGRMEELISPQRTYFLPSPRERHRVNWYRFDTTTVVFGL